LLGPPSWSFNGSSSASASGAPNINFYLLLDDSPSMAIAGTPDGLTTMVNNTSAQGGCAFGCHETNPAADNLGNPGGIDNYQLARNLGVTLRLDLVNQATQNLMTYAQSAATQNNTTYRAGIYTMDYANNMLYPVTADLASARLAAANIQPLTVYDNNCLTVSNCNSDQDSYLDAGLQWMNN